MIFKKDLLESIDCLTEQVFLQGEQIRELENKIKKLGPRQGKPGRPRKEK